MSEITKKEVEHIAKLARIDLKDSETEKMTKELGSILEYITVLNDVKTKGVEPLAHVTGTEEVYREDNDNHEPNQFSDRIVEQFPSSINRYNKVKGIIKK